MANSDSSSAPASLDSEQMKELEQSKSIVPLLLADKWKGVSIAVLIAATATFVSEHYGGPQLLYALLIGLAFHFLTESEEIRAGIDFSARTLLRIGVALLGVRITLSQVAGLGVETALLIATATAGTILLGVFLARLLGRPNAEGVLSGASVGICGASAALAVSAVLPNNKDTARFTLMVVVGVTLLSTVAMVIYPYILYLADLSSLQNGIFLGGTIHDVAQVVAAGMLLGQETGDTATVVKLFRVVLLLPVVLLVSFAYRSQAFPHTEKTEASSKKPPLIPGFLLAFSSLVVLSSSGLFSKGMIHFAGDSSRWLLVVAISAAGLKTSFKDLALLGWKPVVMLVAETIFLAAFVLLGIFIFHPGA